MQSVFKWGEFYIVQLKVCLGRGVPGNISEQNTSNKNPHKLYALHIYVCSKNLSKLF